MQIPIARPLFKPVMNPDSKLLFYTYANSPYHEFAILYPLFVLLTNESASVEICISDPDVFTSKYLHLIKHYAEAYPGRVLYSYISPTNIFPNSLRFLVKPISKSIYIYIGDVDILILEQNILNIHLAFINDTRQAYSNVRRKGMKKLTGLHFIEYDKYYPVCIPQDINLETCNDEELLFLLMLNKGYKTTDITDLKYRPTHGIHISFFSRPPLPTLTTQDRMSTTPSWFGQSIDSLFFVKRYMQLRYIQQVEAFMSVIKDEDIALRRLIQLIDIYCYYIQNEYGGGTCKI
jgi:hypothetical protein